MRKYYIMPKLRVIDLGPHAGVLDNTSIPQVDDEEVETMYGREERNDGTSGRGSLWSNEW